MKILLSGASGFIGKNFLKYFNQNHGEHNILIIGRNLQANTKKNLYLEFDLNNIEKNFNEVKEFNPDVFLHLAWEGIPNYSEKFSEKNYENTMKIICLIANETNCKKIISTGSCWEYNDGNLIGECREDYLIKPSKPFSIYKQKIFEETKKIANDKRILFNWLRLFYVYGPSQKNSSIIPMLAEKLTQKKEININYPANKNDFIYIDDVSKILSEFIINNYISGAFNVGTGKSTSIYELLKIIDLHINGNNEISEKYLRKVNLSEVKQDFYASTKKLIKHFKNFDFTDINLGIHKFLNKS